MKKTEKEIQDAINSTYRVLDAVTEEKDEKGIESASAAISALHWALGEEVYDETGFNFGAKLKMINEVPEVPDLEDYDNMSNEQIMQSLDKLISYLEKNAKAGVK